MARPLHAHPTDLAIAHDAAHKLGKLLAQNLLDYSEIVAAFPQESDDERMRLIWTLTDSAMYWEWRRARAERDIADAIRPMILRLDDALDIIAQAHAVNERHDNALLRHEARDVAVTAMAYRLQAERREKRRG